VVTDYPTKPVECWSKMKELRKKHFFHIWNVQKEGGVLVMGTVQIFMGFLAGLGNFANANYAPQFTRLMDDTKLAVRNHEAFEAKGYGREMCSAMRCHLGQLYQGLSLKSPLGGEFRPDFIFDFSWCADTAKTAQLASEYLGIPYYIVDVPYKYNDQCIDYMVNQLHEAIEWLEKVTGRAYDDEKLIEAVNNEWECCVLWAKISELTKLIPAPIDARHLNSLRLPSATSRHKEEVVQFHRMVYDEVLDRVKNGISARGFERKRLSLDTSSPFYFPQLLRWPEEYGSVIIGGQRFFDAFGAWEVKEDTLSWKVMKTPAERGLQLRTREDALRALAELNVKYMPIQRIYDLTKEAEEYLQFVKDWKIDATTFAYDRGCKGYLSAGLPETALAMKRNGIPALSFDCSMADPRDFDEKSVKNKFDIFLESLGLTKLNA